MRMYECTWVRDWGRREEQPVCFHTWLLVQALLALEETKNLYGNRIRGFISVFYQVPIALAYHISTAIDWCLHDSYLLQRHSEIICRFLCCNHVQSRKPQSQHRYLSHPNYYWIFIFTCCLVYYSRNLEKPLPILQHVSPSDYRGIIA